MNQSKAAGAAQQGKQPQDLTLVFCRRRTSDGPQVLLGLKKRVSIYVPGMFTPFRCADQDTIWRVADLRQVLTQIFALCTVPLLASVLGIRYGTVEWVWWQGEHMIGCQHSLQHAAYLELNHYCATPTTGVRNADNMTRRRAFKTHTLQCKQPRHFERHHNQLRVYSPRKVPLKDKALVSA